jgi:hypothetical protein
MNQQLAPFKLTDDLELREDPSYKRVIEIVKELWDTDVIARAAGYCFSISDMVSTLMRHSGIESEIVECQLMVKRVDPPVMIALGYDHRRDSPQQITTHVVVITKTEIPMIIDLSIGNLQPDQVRLIVERANGKNGTIATLDLGKTTWIYTAKKDQKFPHFYQQSIVDRIQTDQRVKREINWLKILIIVAISISSLNAVRGGYDFYQTYLDDGNSWGPARLKQLTEQVQRLEELIKKPVNQRD